MISRDIGKKLSSLTPAHGQTTANVKAQRSNPITLTPVPYRPLPSHSALGLSAFYISLLSIMCGFLGAILVNSTVDSALGFATTEIGPKWRQRAPVRISRWQTLLAKWLMALVLSPVLTGVMLLVAVGITKLDDCFFGLLVREVGYWRGVAGEVLFVAVACLVVVHVVVEVAVDDDGAELEDVLGAVG